MSDSNLHQQNSNLHCPIPIYIGWIPISKVQIPIYIGWTSIYKVEIPIYIGWIPIYKVEIPIYISWILIYKVVIRCPNLQCWDSNLHCLIPIYIGWIPICKVEISNLHWLNSNLHEENYHFRCETSRKTVVNYISLL